MSAPQHPPFKHGSFIHRIQGILLNHRYGLKMAIFLGAAIATGAACVLFMWSFEFVIDHPLDQMHAGHWSWVATPLLFILSVWVIRNFGPLAAGAGIPQTIFAAKHLNASNRKALGGLVSIRTMLVKIVALLLAVWGGASTGREGPSVHIAACLFVSIVWYAHNFFKIPFDLKSAVIGGGAAGLAAAFNAPLAGVTFAIEELCSDMFMPIKDIVLMSIIIAGITAKSMTGEYTYFGRVSGSADIPILTVVMIGVAAGAAGAVFSHLIIRGRRIIVAKFSRWTYAAAAFLGLTLLGLSALATYGHLPSVLGPGNYAAQMYLRGDGEGSGLLFFAAKSAATLLTYWSGIAGGIFAPSLSMGSAIGSWLGWVTNGPVAVSALVGMAAFLAGTIQAPITAFVIVYEMTGHHQTLLPVMLAAAIGFMTARVLGAKHLYQTLSDNYSDLLPRSDAPVQTSAPSANASPGTPNPS